MPEDQTARAKERYEGLRDTYWSWRETGVAAELLRGAFERMAAAEAAYKQSLAGGRPQAGQAGADSARATFEEARDTYWALRGMNADAGKLARAFERMKAAEAALKRARAGG